MTNPSWRGNQPSMLTSPTGPNGEPLPTPTDRRWLWHLENSFSVLATTESQREILRDLRQYLNETCEHHWGSDWPDDGCIPAHRQCLWCNHVEWAADAPPRS